MSKSEERVFVHELIPENGDMDYNHHILVNIDDIEQLSVLEDVYIAELKAIAKGKPEFDEVIQELEKANTLRHKMFGHIVECVNAINELKKQ